jgi:hypothetical protein
MGGVMAKRGRHMIRGRGWRLTTPGQKTFVATLLKRFRVGGATIALFKVKKPKLK